MPAYNTIADTGVSDALRDVRSYRSGVVRLFDWIYGMLPHRDDGPMYCPGCHSPATFPVSTIDDATALIQGRRVITLTCGRCASTSCNLIAGLALALPDSRQFWRNHPRIHILPEDTVEINGRPSLVVRYGAVDSLATLDAIVSLDTLHFRVVAGGGA
jgi:hypothetical protein